MKFIILLVLSLLLVATVSFVSADTNLEQEVEDYGYQGSGLKMNQCGHGQICNLVNNCCECSPFDQNSRIGNRVVTASNPPVYLIRRQIGVWQDGSRGGMTFSQDEVVIVNNSTRNIKQIYIGTDSSFRLRDQSNTNLFNMVLILPGRVLQLPSYQQSINSGATYTFGFIIEGAAIPNLPIVGIQYQ